MRKALFAVALVMLLVLGSAGRTYAITNGEPDAGRHPYVGLAIFDDESGPAWRCSGALLSPTVVLLAGHCTDGAVAARFFPAEIVQGNAEYPGGGTTSYEGVPYTNPDFCIECSSGLPNFAYRDVGIIVLSEPVPTSVVGEYAELPEAGLVDTLARKATIDLVGYGVQNRVRGGGQPVWTGVRNRLYARGQVVSGTFVHASEFLRVTANPGGGKGGTCFGDSGGPDLLGGADIVLAINSYVTNLNCTGVTYGSRVDIPEVLYWIEGFLD